MGTMGRHHVRIASQLPEATLVGLHDPDEARAKLFSSQFACEAFDTLEGLIDSVDALIVAAPTTHHERIGRMCIEKGKHLLMEKPLADSLDAARGLVEMAESAGVVLMVGHVERYNPAIQGLMELLRERDEEVVSFDARRLAPFDGSRCLDVDVLHDLLVHDVDIALEVVGSEIRNVSAWGRAVFSDKTDVVHARIEFANKASASFWVGKCTPKKVRSITVATPSRFLEADTLTNALTVHQAGELPDLSSNACFMGDISVCDIDVPAVEPLTAEQQDFYDSILCKRAPLVNGHRALQSMEALELVRQALAE